MFKKSGRGFKKPFCVNPACSNFLPEEKRGYPKKKTAEDKAESAGGKAAETEKPAVKKAAAKKTGETEKPAKSTAKKAAEKKPAAKKTAAKKPAAKKATTKKTKTEEAVR